MAARSASPTLYVPSRSVSPSPSRRNLDWADKGSWKDNSGMRKEGETQDVTDGNSGQKETTPVEKAGAGKADRTPFAEKDEARILEREGKDPNEVDFDGPDDPFNPLTQPIWRKWVSVFTVASGAICVTCASSMASSTYAGIEDSFGISNEVAILTVSLFVMGLGVGPLLVGPVSEFIGRRAVYLWSYIAFLSQAHSWVPFWWSAVELALIYFFAPETYKPQVLKIKAAHLRKTTGNQDLYAPVERSDRSFMQTLAKSVKTPFIILLTQPMAVLLNLWTSLLLGILYLFFNAFPITFMGYHGFNQQESGLSFLGIGLGQVLASACAPLWSKLYKREAAKHGGIAPPESRLLMGMAGAIATATNTHWIAPILGSIPFGMGIVWTFSSVFTYLVDAYRPVAASAMASNSFMRSSFAAGFPLFARQMFNRLGTFGASALLAGLVTCLVPLPFVFYRIGGGIRERSKFGAGSKVAEEEKKGEKA
ncbi:hypothetical protein QFC20_004647 [Naganishia adeliensis]|uniref:Uncharacterized protein n=1 Tax=Naganishia adeliensis TaxID=92952 RepID=A0ACC2VYX3_9TREE|nr:hypothetical protein QFC20_004647 [Naganishia adeliensis]